MREIEGGIAVDDLDAGGREQLAGLLVLRFAAAASGVEHDAHFHAPLMSCDHGLQQAGIGEDEHLDAERFRRVVDRIEDRPGSIVRQYD